MEEHEEHEHHHHHGEYDAHLARPKMDQTFAKRNQKML